MHAEKTCINSNTRVIYKILPGFAVLPLFKGGEGGLVGGLKSRLSRGAHCL